MPLVLILCEYATLNGGERSMLSTLESIMRGGFLPTVAAPGRGPLANALSALGLQVMPFDVRDASGHHRPTAGLREDLANLLDRLQPDLLHANSLSMGRLSGPVAALRRLPSLAHLRDIIKLGPQAVADLNCHARLLAVSNATRDAHLARGLSREKTHVLRNGVDLRQFQPRPSTGFLHRELGLPRAAPLIGTIGQISLRKGQDALVEAATAMCRAAEGAEAHWLILGERFSGKDESRQFEAGLRVAAAGPLAGRLHFLGVREDVPQVLNELTLLVHPARQEPLGRVLLEAAASGVAVVATDVGGTREIFPPDRNAARLVPPEDAAALAQAMLELLGNPAARRCLAAAARQRAEEAFDLQDASRGLIRHYAEVCGL